MQSATMTSIWEEIGVKPVINARGHNTVLGGSTPTPRIKEAMEAAERYYVDMNALLERSGEVCAELIGAEAAYVTPGAAAAMALGTAAIVAGTDMEKVARLPDTAGLPNKVLIQAGHHYSYERAPTIVGTKLVEVGANGRTTAEQLDAAIGADTATILFPAHLDGKEGTVPLKQVLEIAHAKGLPVLVDAAGQIYPLERFKSWTAMGCDLVCFGAKYFNGPNSAGLLVGRRDLVKAASVQGFIGFETVANRKAFGRPLKLDRQEIVAVVVALQEWFAMDHPRRVARLEQRCEAIKRPIANAPGCSFSIVEIHASAPKVLRIEIDPTKAKKSADEVDAALREGSPQILVNREPNALLVNPNTVWEGDEEIIAQRLRALLA
jgi:D-glucosaminate-6-phosphate ammonia-lyase